MAEKSSEAEGSSIFESLFGGFSNGLSIFTNNPFRRKNETVALSTEEDGGGENDVVSASQMPKNAEDLLDQSLEGEDLPTALEDNSDSSLKNIKKRADDEEEVVSEKKRRKTESEQELNVKSGSNDSRKRNAGDWAGLDDTISTESKKKTKMKKKTPSLVLESSEPQHDFRQSTRKKRLNEDLLLSQEIGHKERKVEKTFAEIVEPDLRVEKELSGEADLKQTVKRPQGPDVEENEKKKSKRLDDMNPEIPALGKGAEELVAGTPASAVPRETRGSKRKKDSNVEELYEKKRRETVDGKENTKEQQGSAIPQLRGKRKLSDDEEDAATVSGAMTKKKKTTKEERMDNEERLKRTIFVGNLPINVKPKHLLREFSQFGAVESARLRSVPLVDTKLPRKAAVITGQLNESRSSMNGYVVFLEEESARAALAHNMTEFHGKHIRVDMATPPRKGDKIGESGIEYDRSRSIFVGNLPFDVEDEEVYSLFQGKTSDLEVEAVRVVRDPQTSIGKGFAFVCFKKKIGATTALDNAEFARLRNRQLRIIRFGFQKKPTGSNLSARDTSGNYRSKPRPGAEERINKRNVLPYEGTRASKVDGRPGKAAGAARKLQKGKFKEKGNAPKSGKTGKSSALPKRPSVAARKWASQGNAGAIVPTGGKRKREEKGKKKRSFRK